MIRFSSFLSASCGAGIVSRPAYFCVSSLLAKLVTDIINRTVTRFTVKLSENKSAV